MSRQLCAVSFNNKSNRPVLQFGNRNIFCVTILIFSLDILVSKQKYEYGKYRYLFKRAHWYLAQTNQSLLSSVSAHAGP